MGAAGRAIISRRSAGTSPRRARTPRTRGGRARRRRGATIPNGWRASVSSAPSSPVASRGSRSNAACAKKSPTSSEHRALEVKPAAPSRGAQPAHARPGARELDVLQEPPPDAVPDLPRAHEDHDRRRPRSTSARPAGSCSARAVQLRAAASPPGPAPPPDASRTAASASGGVAEARDPLAEARQDRPRAPPALAVGIRDRLDLEPERPCRRARPRAPRPARAERRLRDGRDRAVRVGRAPARSDREAQREHADHRVDRALRHVPSARERADPRAPRRAIARLLHLRPDLARVLASALSTMGTPSPARPRPRRF